MAIPSSDGPKEGSYATSELLSLNSCLSFSSFFKVYLLSYFEFGFYRLHFKGNYRWDSHGSHYSVGFHEM